MASLLSRTDAAGSLRLLSLLNQTRLLAAGISAASFAALSVVWRWPTGLVVTAAATGIAVHALWRRTHPDRPPTDILLVDITTTVIVVVIVEPPLVVLLPPIVAFLVTALLMLPGRSAGLVVAYLTAAVMAAAGVIHVGGAAEWNLPETVTLTAIASIVFLPFMVLLLREAARAETDRDTLGHDLTESQRRHTSLIDGLPVGVYRTTPDGRILDVNSAMVDMLGYPDRATLLATPIRDSYAEPGERDAWVAEMNARGVVTGHETRLRRSDGTVIWARDSGRAATAPDGTILHYEGTLEDVTERVRLAAYERAVADCAQALLTEQTDDAIGVALHVLLDASGADVVFVRRNVDHPDTGPSSTLVHEANRLGVSPDHERWGLVPWERVPRLHAHLSRGEPFAFRTEDLVDDEGVIHEHHPTSILDVPIFSEDRWLGLIGFTDVGGEREWSPHDVAIAQTVARLIGAAWERDDQRLRLERLLRSRDNFIASVSHRLRTPLTTVVGASQLLSEPGTLGKAERDEFIGHLAAQSLDVANVVEDLLVAARTDIGTIALQPQPVDLRSTVGSALEALPVGRLREVAVAETTVTANADQMRVSQILRNLLDNAGRYGGPDVRVRFADGDARARVSVVDDGPGLDPSAGDPFEPLETLPVGALPGSLGLGLTISHRLARMMDGDLRYERVGGDSVFTLDLPAA